MTKEFNEFEAIRWVSPDGTKLKLDSSGNPVEVVVKFKKGTGAKASSFVEEKTDAHFQMSSSGTSGDSYMTAAIRAKPGPDDEPVRFNAQLKEDKRSQAKTYATGPEGRRFVEEKGSRYLQTDQLGVIYVPSTWAVILALLLNLLHFAIWFVAFWPILQFTRGHALALTAVFGVLTMLLVMPLLFERARPAKTAAGEQKTAWMQRPETGDAKPEQD